jgi:AmmeMemoRadiSam system protein B/AmmeMemoRadiSam system protein A
MEYFPFVSVFDGDAYETPLGLIPVDKTMANEIASADPILKLSDNGHIQSKLSSREHALEVQLPFLQAVLDEFRIVPIVMGDQSWETCCALGDALGPILKRDNVVTVISSDLSHFYPHDVATEMDGVFLYLLKQMDPQRLHESVRQKTCEACGAGPVVSGLIAAKHFDGAGCHILSSATSGDVTGDRDRVVGYACAAICATDNGATDAMEGTEHEGLALGKAERMVLLEHARRSIEISLSIPDRVEAPCEYPSLSEKRGAFVTLEVRGRLRGCVGTIEPRGSIWDMTGKMAIAAAMSDPRFDMLTSEELQELRIEISILSPLRQIRSPEEIRIGRHGLVIKRPPSTGLLLPQVAQEHGWQPREFLEYTCEKAGLPRNAWRDKSTQIFVFSATVFGEEKELTH